MGSDVIGSWFYADYLLMLPVRLNGLILLDEGVVDDGLLVGILQSHLLVRARVVTCSLRVHFEEWRSPSRATRDLGRRG